MTELEFQTSFSAIAAMKTNVEQIVVNLSIELAKANIVIAELKAEIAGLKRDATPLGAVQS